MWKTILQAALELVFPPRRQCPLCGGHSEDAWFCQSCLQLLDDYAQEPICSVCGSFWGGSSGNVQRVALCLNCGVGDRPFNMARSVGPYEGPLRDAVHRLKYRGVKEVARPLGYLMAQTALREPALTNTQALVPVPLSTGRERQRGFNQALLLARALGEYLDVPVLERVVVKKRETPTQTGLSRGERLKNLIGAFDIAMPEAVCGKKITIVDDVFTTGSTITIISQSLRQYEAAKVMAITLAGARQFGKK